MFVLVVVIDVVAKMDVVGVPNCGTVVVGVPNCETVVVGVPNCGIAVAVDGPNVGIALLLIVLKLLALLAVVAGNTIDVLGVLEAPKTNRGLLVGKVDVEEVTDVVPSENVGVLDSPNVDAVAVVVFAVNEPFATVVIEVLGVKLKDLVVACDNDVVLFAGFPKAFIFGWMLLLDWLNMKLSSFGDCKVEIVLFFPKVNKGAIADVVTLLDVFLFTTLLKLLTMLVAAVVLTGNNVPRD